MTAGVKRVDRKRQVADWCEANGDANLHEIVLGTGLSAPAASRALQDIRRDPAYFYITVPTRDGGYVYRIAHTVAEMKAGVRNQTLHLLTRAESMIVAGAKATALAVTPDEYALAADIAANGRMLKAQAEAILKALV